MSDCSTQAIKPKEPPKTCRNCSERVLTYVCGRTGCRDFEENNTPDDDGWTYADHCLYWKHAVEPSPEQRYRQLEQVAKEMLDAIRISSSYHMSIKPNYYESFASQLEALGVSLDD